MSGDPVTSDVPEHSGGGTGEGSRIDRLLEWARHSDRVRLYQVVGGALCLVVVAAVVTATVTVAVLRSPGVGGRTRLQGVAFDGFARPDGSELATTETGVAWRTFSGRWRIENGRARVAFDPGRSSGLALIDTGAADQYVEATFTDPTAGAGLVTRFEGINNFVGLTFAPEAASVRLAVTVDGSTANPAPLGRTVAEGTVTLGMRTEGETVIVYIDGVETGRQVVAELRDQTRVGVLVRDENTKVDDVIAIPMSSDLASRAPAAPVTSTPTTAAAGDQGSEAG